jgi:hypothetical protein
MARLALLAMLLLASLPTAGRLVASTQAEPGWTALCTSNGMQWVRPGGHGSPAFGHDGDDCAYCPLLHALDPPVVSAAWRPPPATPTAFVVESTSQRSPDAPRSGLGARGPPRIPAAIA